MMEPSSQRVNKAYWRQNKRSCQVVHVLTGVLGVLLLLLAAVEHGYPLLVVSVSSLVFLYIATINHRIATRKSTFVLGVILLQSL
jgi:hypothetical protein